MDRTTASGPGGMARARSGGRVARVDADTRDLASGHAAHGGGSDHGDLDRLIAARVHQRLFTDPPAVPRIARFMVLERIGRGGMGTVYAAYDELLDRKVAVKVLPPDDLPALQDRVRFQREAQALARLSHPHVVTVHEVGDADGELFVAMEFIRGQDLARWLRTAPVRPGWRVVLDAFVQAGRGLAAVHQAGLVHRDVKPTNIMRRDDGVVKLLDFGLARTVGDEPQRSRDGGPTMESSPGPGLGPLGSLTCPGTVMGTPAYMSPEQLRGQVVDARSDQFGFCVALYEALYGERPYPGTTMDALKTSLFDGRIPPPPKDRPVPARLRTVLLRGLATDPQARWPSMEALLEPLQRLLAPRRGRWLASGASVALGLGLLGIGRAYQADVGQRCTGARAQLAGIWDDDRRRAVEAAILGTELPYAPSTWARVEARLEAYADAWTGKHAEICEATAVRHEQPEAAMRLRMRCLHERRTSLRASVDLLARTDDEVVHNAVDLVTGLPALTRCDDLERLEQQDQRIPLPEDPHVAAEVEALRERLAEIRATQDAGRYAEALEQVEPVVQRAEALGYPPLLAEAQRWRGDLREDNGQLARAEQDLRRAHTLAMEHHHDQVALDTAQELTFVVGSRLARHAEGRQWGEMVAWPLAKRSGEPIERAMTLNNLGYVYFRQGAYEQAKEHHERALAIWVEAKGPDHALVANSLSNLGIVVFSRGEYEQSEEYFERSLAILDEAMGSDHPLVASGLTNLGNAYSGQGKYDEALEHLQRALALKNETLGDDHPDVAAVLNSLGTVYSGRGEYRRAQAHHERALAIMQKVRGDDHLSLLHSLSNLGNALSHQGEFDEATKHYERALAIRQRIQGEDHPELASDLNNLGGVYFQRGELDKAQQYHERALQMRQKSLGDDHPLVASSLNNLGIVFFGRGELDQARRYHERALGIEHEALSDDHPAVAYSLMGLAAVAIKMGDLGSARAHAERAVSIREAAAVAPDLLAEARFALAQALWGTRREQARARALAEQAREGLAASEGRDDADPDLAEIDTWLATHRVTQN